MATHESSGAPHWHRSALAAALACIAAGATAAQTQHGAHEHGSAAIELAVEGSSVAVHFASPLYNLVGFEHAPRDEGDREAVAAARALLDDPANLVLLDAQASCTATAQDVHWDADAAEENDHGETGAHDDDEHEAHEEHEGAAHDDGHADHEDAAHDDDEHADVAVTMRFSCDHPDRLGALTVTAFESFERLSEVELRGIGPGGAVAATPSRSSPGVDLGGLLGR